MITDWGMSDKFKNVVFHTRKQPSMLGEMPGMRQREHSEQTQQYIDESVAKILAERFEKVKAELSKREKTLREVAAELLERETIGGEEFKSMVGEEARENPQEQKPREKDRKN
jgi:cell division protease FtsH